MPHVCVDASFALKLVLIEPDTPRVLETWGRWETDRFTIIAPWLWRFECDSVLRRKVWQRLIHEDHAREARLALRRRNVRLVHPQRVMDRAWELATEFGRPTIYDMVYVATAELRGCELWTADQRLINAVARFSWIRSV